MVIRNKYNSPKTATYPLLGITILCFIIQVFSKEFTNTFILSTADILVRPWILITSMFLHGGAGHLFFNMYVLLIFGPLLESRIGKKRFLITYFLSGIIAGIGYSLLAPNSFALGASGAMMGILGVTIMLMPDLKVLFFFILPMSLRTAGIIIALIDILGVFNPNSGIAHWAHLFGLGAGIVYGSYLLTQKKKFQKSFNILRKYEDAPIRKESSNRIKDKPEIKDADYTEKILLKEADIEDYLKYGKL